MQSTVLEKLFRAHKSMGSPTRPRDKLVRFNVEAWFIQEFGLLQLGLNHNIHWFEMRGQAAYMNSKVIINEK